MGISFLISFLSFRAFANVVRSQIYFVSLLVWYYPQEATIIVLGRFLYSCLPKCMLILLLSCSIFGLIF